MTWVCKVCGSMAERYTNGQGTWLSCSNDECKNYNHMKREEDGDFLDYYVLPKY